MINYNELITLARNEGKSLEDIAKEFSNALNEASKSSPREDYMAELEDTFVSAVMNEHIYLEAAIAGVVLCVAEEHPNWDVDIIKSFEASLTDSVETNTRLTDCYVNDGNLGETMLDLIKEALGKKRDKSDDEKLSEFFKGLGL